MRAVSADALERCFSKSSMMATTVSFWLLVASSFGVRPSCGAVPCSMSRGRGAATVGGGFEGVGVQANGLWGGDGEGGWDIYRVLGEDVGLRGEQEPHHRGVTLLAAVVQRGAPGLQRRVCGVRSCRAGAG